ncbi:MAG: NUDIX hydrolase [Chloroflexi bacterium]|nr:NUDIX hydrolase [Chloroflexota bacterium]
MSRRRVVPAFSAGGLVYRRENGQVEVALVGKRTPRIWGLPKGTPTRGESSEQAALREVTEETGLTVQLVAPLSDIEYWFVASGRRFHKTVRYYLMRATGGDTSLHDAEHDEVAWMAADLARQALSYANERRILELGLQQIEQLAFTNNDEGDARAWKPNEHPSTNPI